MESESERRMDVNYASHLLVEMAQERSLDALLHKLIHRLIERPDVACVQIWLLDEVASAAQLNVVPEKGSTGRTLRLVAGLGQSLAGEVVDGPPFYDSRQQVAWGEGLIGSSAAEGRQIMVREVSDDPRALADFEWIERERVRSFGATPIQFKGEVLGVIAGFTRQPVREDAHIWGQIFADHIGAAFANVRAFQQIEHLKAQLELQNSYLQEEVEEAKAFGELVGKSPVLEHIIRQIDLVAPTDASVLILGETGTGKELVAREIHRRSARKDKPMVRVNCASIPRELYESEFFGHVKGAFTGAIKDRAGRFETAEGGTLFLDEVGEIPMELQGKLLRVLQEKRYERVGDDRTRLADVRIIGATNRDLKAEVAAGRFRQDLYYRLNVFPIQVATLRERLEDVPLLAAHFIELSVRELRCPRPRLTRAGVAQLQAYSWPGNVRELRNVIQRAVILARGGALQFDLPGAENSRATVLSRRTPTPENGSPRFLTEVEMRQRERENLIAVLEAADWKIMGQGGAAELLGVKPTTLFSRIKKFGIEKPESRNSR